MSGSSDLLDLEGRIALVSGAGQGVGASTAHHLAAQGAKVVVNDFVADRATDVATQINDDGGTAIGVQGDVTDFTSVTAMVDVAREAFGPVDVLVNNAGNAGADPSPLTGKPFWEKDPAEWAPFLDVNLYGVLHCCRAVLPGMIDAGKGGRIITVISEAGRVERYTIRRFGEPSDVAAMITFLASNAAGWITGQTYPVNGGFSVSQ